MTFDALNSAITQKGYEFQAIHGDPPTRLILGTSENAEIDHQFHRSKLFDACGLENTRRQYRGLQVFVVDAATFLEVL